jgi:hypothetical protein
MSSAGYTYIKDFHDMYAKSTRHRPLEERDRVFRSEMALAYTPIAAHSLLSLAGEGKGREDKTGNHTKAGRERQSERERVKNIPR